MERRGVYRKGSSGHVRNVGLYRLFRQNFKKWRAPITVFVALLFIFGVSPAVGDQFQASLLTADQTEKISQAAPEEGKKMLLGALKEFIDNCTKYQITDCIKQGNALMTDSVSFGTDVLNYAHDIEAFVANYESDVAVAACVYDIGAVSAVAQIKAHEINTFLEKYSDALNVSGAVSRAENFIRASEELKKVVEACEKAYN